MAMFNKMAVLLGGLALSLLGTIGSAAAQCHGGSHHSFSHGSSRGSGRCVVHTEANNRFGSRLGILGALDKQKTFFRGVTLESVYFAGPRLQVGGQFTFTGYSATPTNFGYEATGPILDFVNLGLALRYMLGNGQRWRLDALGGSGLNAYNLADKDRQVTNSCGCTGPAPVEHSMRPMLDAGLGLTYKLWRQVWLTSDLRYAQVLGSAPLGSTALQSRWQLSLALAVPSGFVRHSPVAAPAAPQ